MRLKTKRPLNSLVYTPLFYLSSPEKLRQIVRGDYEVPKTGKNRY